MWLIADSVCSHPAAWQGWSLERGLQSTPCQKFLRILREFYETSKKWTKAAKGWGWFKFVAWGNLNQYRKWFLYWKKNGNYSVGSISVSRKGTYMSCVRISHFVMFVNNMPANYTQADYVFLTAGKHLRHRETNIQHGWVSTIETIRW